MNYIVMECHSSYAVLLDEEGRFLKAANLCYEVGQKVENPVLMKETSPRKILSLRRITGGIAAAAACVLILFGARYYQTHMISYSAIYLNINPEVRIELNRQGQVLKLEGTNEDGKVLLEGYDGKGKDKLQVADELIDRAIEMGFLSEGGQVAFSIDSPDEILFEQYGKELQSEVNRHLKNRLTITIEIIDYQTGESESSTTQAPSRENSNNEDGSVPDGQIQTAPTDQKQIQTAPAGQEQIQTPSGSQGQNQSAPAQPSQEQTAPASHGQNQSAPAQPSQEQVPSAGENQQAPAVPPAAEEGESDYGEDGDSDYGDNDDDDEEDDD